MNNPRRAIFAAMTIGVVATFLAMSSGRKDRLSFWRVGIAAPVATFLLLVVSEVAPELAVGFAWSYATGAVLGGKAAADLVVKVLGGPGTPASGAGTVETIPNAVPISPKTTGGGVLFPSESQLA